MKLRYLLIVTIIVFFSACSSNSNSEEFIKTYSGRYLFNADEVIEIYFKDSELFIAWRGATAIKPLKVDKHTFYVKEMNEKIQFLTNPKNNKQYITLIPKETNDTISSNFMKLETNEKIPSEYLKNNDFKKALEAYKAIKENDSLNEAVNENNFNSLGYKELRKNNFDLAINIFKINVALYPNSSNVYDSLGEALLKNGDTLQAIENYKTALKLDSGNLRAKRIIKQLEKN